MASASRAIRPLNITTGNSSPLLTIGAGATAIGLAYWFIAKPILDKMKAQGDLKRDQESTIKPAKGKILKDLTGKPTTSANLATIASDIQAALHPGWYRPADQARAVRVFQSTPWGYVPQLEKIYLDKYQKQLKQELVDYLSDTNWIKIKFNFR